VFFWIFYVLFFGSIYGKYGNNYGWYMIESLCMLPFIMLATYTTIYRILPFYLKKRKLIVTVLMVVALLFLVTLGERVCLRLINNLEVTLDTIFGVTFLYLLLETNFMVGIAFAIKLVKKWFEQQNEKHEMEKRNLETELNLLKAQLHPHFLFNTMNNLYALSVEKSAKTSEGIAKISDLLRSVLYECNEAEILLEKEIKLIENYIDLEKMRYGDRLHFQFNISGPVEEMKIAPMLLFTFVENCFKHGSRNDPEHPYIKINLEISERKMVFVTENSKPIPAKEPAPNNISGGIGLANVKKRLGIIYGDNCILEISNKKRKFMVRLVINK
jgi:sensor histidine kinase YesM